MLKKSSENHIRIENIELELDSNNLIQIPNSQELSRHLGKTFQDNKTEILIYLNPDDDFEAPTASRFEEISININETTCKGPKFQWTEWRNLPTSWRNGSDYEILKEHQKYG